MNVQHKLGAVGDFPGLKGMGVGAQRGMVAEFRSMAVGLGPVERRQLGAVICRWRLRGWSLS